MTRINVFDQDTLEALRAQGVGAETIQRVEIVMRDATRMDKHAEQLADQNEDLLTRVAQLEEQLAGREPQVAWVVPLSYAQVLVDYLHRHMPGGYQAYHDELREAIGRARSQV